MRCSGVPSAGTTGVLDCERRRTEPEREVGAGLADIARKLLHVRDLQFDRRVERACDPEIHHDRIAFLDVLHHEVQEAVPHTLGVREPGEHDLDRDFAGEVEVLGEEDGGHTAAAKLATDFVFAEGRAAVGLPVCDARRSYFFPPSRGIAGVMRRAFS